MPESFHCIIRVRFRGDFISICQHFRYNSEKALEAFRRKEAVQEGNEAVQEGKEAVQEGMEAVQEGKKAEQKGE